MRPDFIATQAYPFMQRAQQRGHAWEDQLENAMREAAEAGLDGWEPIVRTPDQVEGIALAAKRHRLEMPSIYIGGAMHDEVEGRRTFENMVAIAEKARPWGVRFILINPNPIDWKGKENKTDGQLILQASLLAALGGRFHEMGLRLCYHSHDAEMRASAREFHHMLTATDPNHVRLCLDPHWIYRGAENSEIALHDIITHYGDRIELVHLRQSRDGIWDEILGPGDLDHEHLATRFTALDLQPLLVLERALEEGTPETMSDVEAHRRSAAYARQLFASARAEGSHA
ncbi:TIM barrel protein [Chelativorans sp.]|uniref:sugar phosphate isomerase/epimerase family protein n=1 Tax=Chelativorans sp. TaxID=2203393 RepID=UPI002810DF3F|nr:TIM barrel protein [Chelativorans sp.]